MPAFGIEVVPETASTNATLMQRVRAHQTEPCILVAAHQSAGRGRMGKGWVSTPGHSLTFSMALPMSPATWSGLSLAVGVSVAESLSTLLPATVPDPSGGLSLPRPTIQLKWPNDVWLHDHKLAGILIETAHLHTATGRQPWVVIGIGINLQAPSDIATPHPIHEVAATQLSSVPPIGLQEWHAVCDVGTVLNTVAPSVLQDVLCFETHGFAPFHARFSRRDALWQRPLCLSDGTQGVGMGVDVQGVLQVQTSQGWRAVDSQEVSVRPLATPTVEERTH